MADIAEPIRFGFLFVKSKVLFSHGSITPIPEFERYSKAILRRRNLDGYLYPPTVRDVEVTASGNMRTKPKTKRPAHLFPIAASHELLLEMAKPEDKVREESAAFIMYLLCLFFETRLQFEGWFVDGRIPVRTDCILAGYPGVLGDRLSLAYEVWLSWPVAERERFLKILYMFSRSKLYEWDWENFLVQYMIVAACWRMGKVLFHFKAKRHQDRLFELYKHFGVHSSVLDDLTKLADIRNDLVHEVSWLGGRPTHVNPLRVGQCFDPGIRLQWINRYIIGSFLKLPDMWN